ncbi:hypothetical protein [Streptomyces sviceus]|uniref:hypothetical protein n=1 Tax=Streptomyces sviceus TaxID=285530 RepID=UPI0036B7490F
MSGRYASRIRPRPSDPVGFVLNLLWAVGTAAGFVCLGLLAGNHVDEPLAHDPALTNPDVAPVS